MDPVTIVTVVSSCSQLALRSVTLVADFGRLKDKLRHVERDVQMVVTQVNAIKGVVNQLSQWLQQNATSTTKELLPEVLGVLECCTELVTLIGQHVDKVKGGTRLKLKAGVAQLLGEDRLREYQQMLQGQLQALTLLIQCLQLRTPSERTSFVQLVENKTTLIQGKFEFNAPQPTSTAPHAMRPSSSLSSERQDSAIALLQPSELRVDRLAIEAPPSRGESLNFFKDMPRPTADLKASSERRYYSVDAPVAKVDPYAGTADDENIRQKAFGLKFLGKISRKSVIQFDKLTMPEVLMDWPQWHREQRSRAIKDGNDLAAVLNSGLYTAVRLKHVEYITELFDNGAEETAWHGTSWTLMHHALMFADERVITMLLEQRVNIDTAVERHGSPLHYAVQNCHENAVEILLSHNADPNITDMNSCTPLYFALRYLLAIDQTNKQTDPKWPFGKSEATRSAICYELRVGVRNVLLLLGHGARASSQADELRWPSSIQQKLAKTQTHDLPGLIAFLADPLAPGIPEAAVDVYLWIQHALRDSLREAAKGSASGAAVRAQSKSSSSSGSTGSSFGSFGSVKSVRFEERQQHQPTKKVQAKALSGKSGAAQKTAKTADAERLEKLLGLD